MRPVDQQREVDRCAREEHLDVVVLLRAARGSNRQVHIPLREGRQLCSCAAVLSQGDEFPAVGAP